MDQRIGRVLLWALLAAYLAMVGAGVLLTWLIWRAPDVDVYPPGFLALFSFSAFVVVGVFIVSRFSENRFGWLLMVAGFSWVAFALMDDYSICSFGVHAGTLFGSQFALWVSNWGFFPNLWLVVVVIPLLFPTGHLPRGRWRAVFWTSLVGTSLATLGFMFIPGEIEVSGVSSDKWAANPYAVDHWAVLVSFVVGMPLAIISSIAAGASIVWRLRHTRGVEHLQLKWFAYAGGLNAVAFGATTILFSLGRDELADVAQALLFLGFAAFPIAAGIAIVRYRLFDIDVLIRRTLVYGLLTVCLGFAYLALILASQSAIRAGFGHSSDLATAASTLAVAGLFRPLLGWIQTLVDRRFYRRRYDASQTVSEFSARVRDEVNLHQLIGELHAVVQDTMQPEHVSLWLRSAPRSEDALRPGA
jgi:hypothetical protein